MRPQKQAWAAGLRVAALGALVVGSACGSGDRTMGGPFSPWGIGSTSLPARCQLPFDSGPCEAAIGVFAYVNGACVPRTYGGCEGNENRFSTVDECAATCEVPAGPSFCPNGRVLREVCVRCGSAGGCDATETTCAQTCAQDGDCLEPGHGCFNGHCQAGGGCI